MFERGFLASARRALVVRSGFFSENGKILVDLRQLFSVGG
jgi:hypothetical protein